MKLELASGNWVEMRGPDQLRAGDKAAMNAMITVPIDGNAAAGPDAVGTVDVNLGMVDRQMYAVLAEIVISWSYPMCRPKDDVTDDWSDSIRQIPLDDWDEISDAIAPHMEKLRRSGPKGSGMTTAPSNGTSRARGGASRKA